MEMRIVPDIVTLSVQETSPDDDEWVALLAKRMLALSDPMRLRALHILVCSAEDTVSVAELAQLLGSRTQSNVSTHLQRLVFAGFLECRRFEGRHYYRVRQEAIRQAFSELLSYTGMERG
jgi:DNA-binding transcriptional ArsR family regulator